VLPVNHRLASKDRVLLSELKNDHFVRVLDTCAPGYNQKVTELCRRFGKFKPRFSPRPFNKASLPATADVDRSTEGSLPAAMREIESLTEALSIAANEDEISLNPVFISHFKIPNVVMIPIADSEATWDVFVAWQRGKTSGPLRALVDALTPKPAK
jgi:hypothetical protein